VGASPRLTRAITEQRQRQQQHKVQHQQREETDPENSNEDTVISRHCSTILTSRGSHTQGTRTRTKLSVRPQSYIDSRTEEVAEASHGGSDLRQTSRSGSLG